MSFGSVCRCNSINDYVLKAPMTRTDDVLSIAESVLLAPANLNTQHLASLLNNKLTGQADYADIYFQHSRHEAWVLEDGIVRDASFNTERGAGVRIVQGEKNRFCLQR
jgi:TldD protein